MNRALFTIGKVFLVDHLIMYKGHTEWTYYFFLKCEVVANSTVVWHAYHYHEWSLEHHPHAVFWCIWKEKNIKIF